MSEEPLHLGIVKIDFFDIEEKDFSRQGDSPCGKSWERTLSVNITNFWSETEQASNDRVETTTTNWAVLLN